MAPKYEKAAKQLALHDPPILLAKVDATEESALGQEYGVTGYPDLKVFRKGKPYEYKGEREEQGKPLRYFCLKFFGNLNLNSCFH